MLTEISKVVIAVQTVNMITGYLVLMLKDFNLIFI